MQEWIENHKVRIVVGMFVIIAILILLLFFSSGKKNLKDNNETLTLPLVITCNKKGAADNINLDLQIDVYDGEKERIVVQTTKMSVDNEKLKHALDVAFKAALAQQQSVVDEYFGENFEFITIESNEEEKKVKVYYTYNSQNYNEMFLVFKMDMYSSTYAEIIKLFESGGFTCIKQ